MSYTLRFLTSLALLALLSSCGQDSDPQQQTASKPTSKAAEPTSENSAQSEQITKSDNPFFEEWTTPFGAPPFERIKEAHFVPAFEAGMEAHNKEIAAIASQSQAPTFDNTIAALDKSGELLGKVSQVFFNLSSSHTNDEIQSIQAQMSPRLSKHQTDIVLNQKLFDRVNSLFQQREQLTLNEEQQYMLKRIHSDFVRSGAALEQAAKDRLNEINQEISSLTVNFAQNLLKENNAFELVLETEEELAGLPDFLKASAAETANQRGHDGKYAFTLTRSSMSPFLQFSERRDLREKIYKAWTQRGDNGNDNDNNSIVAKVASLRVERANLLGYKTHADWVLEDRMAGTPEQAYAFMNQIWQPALVKAKEERQALQDMVKSEGQDFEVAAWDWFNYAEKVRKARYDIDDETLKPYFELENVRDGAFLVANRLWGITFHPLENMPKYHEDLQVFEAKDKDGSHLGVFYFDFHSRPNKRGGAWMSSFRGQSKVNGNVRPIVINNLNIPKSSGDIPTLLSFGDASTLFHEFGHGLHGLLSNVTYGRLAGTTGPRDYTEFPAQLMEHWIGDPQVLKETAIHYQTGEAIPDELLKRLKASQQFNQGYATVEYLSAAILDMDWHTLDKTDLQEVSSFERESMDKIGLIPEIVVRYRSTYFGHIFSGPVGYSSGYYSYIWSEILDSDGFKAFKDTGDIYNPELAGRMRKHIYSAGGSDDAMNLFVKFRGKEPTIDALLENRGLKESSQP